MREEERMRDWEGVVEERSKNKPPAKLIWTQDILNGWSWQYSDKFEKKDIKHWSKFLVFSLWTKEF